MSPLLINDHVIMSGQRVDIDNLLLHIPGLLSSTTRATATASTDSAPATRFLNTASTRRPGGRWSCSQQYLITRAFDIYRPHIYRRCYLHIGIKLALHRQLSLQTLPGPMQPPGPVPSGSEVWTLSAHCSLHCGKQSVTSVSLRNIDIKEINLYFVKSQ